MDPPGDRAFLVVISRFCLGQQFKFYLRYGARIRINFSKEMLEGRSTAVAHVLPLVTGECG